MKKLIILLSLSLLLTGCGLVKVIKEEDIPTIIAEELSNVDNSKEIRRNNVLEYYEYYLPSAMAEEDLDGYGIVLKYGESRIIMNLNINNIINEKYYTDKTLVNEGFFVEDYKIYENSGTYLCGELTKNYIYRLYKYEGTYVLHLQTSDMNYYGRVLLSDIRELTRLLMLMAKNTSVDSESIVKDFSNLDVIDYTKTSIDLFDISMPSSGELSSLLIDGAKIGSEEISKDGQISGDGTNNGAPIE